MVNQIQFIFVGGGIRGKSLIKFLYDKGYKANKYYVMKEDAHESEKHHIEIAKYLEKKELEYTVGKKLQDDDYKYISNNNYEFGIVCGWRTIIDHSINSSFRYGLIAAHDSLLPSYRGFAPTNWAIINGEPKTGVTLFKINRGAVDSGPILYQKEIEILTRENINEIMVKVVNVTNELYEKTFNNFPELNFEEQDENKATYTCKRSPDDGEIRWGNTNIKIINLIRALTPPYPGARCNYRNNTYIIHSAKIGEESNKKYIGNIPGKVICINKYGIEVLCGSGTVVIGKWRLLGSEEIINPNKIVKSITDVLAE